MASCFGPRVVHILNTFFGSLSSDGKLQISSCCRPLMGLSSGIFRVQISLSVVPLLIGMYFPLPSWFSSAWSRRGSIHVPSADFPESRQFHAG
ncbi:hypothetical protein LIER_01087 [Lithospermum erythrorhizon]|uniref:Uncharacterized protein n=1 Tax=Lithospermum erythrorhizon TaxID=34254 RepID=A0AAV3NJP7_LITER